MIRFFNKLSILLKLCMLVGLIIIAFSLNLFIAASSLKVLESALHLQKNGSELQNKASDFHSLMYETSFYLFQAESDSVLESGNLKNSTGFFNESFIRCDVELKNLLSFDADPETTDVIQDLVKRYNVYKQSANDAINGFNTSGISTTSLMMLARMSFNALASEVKYLDDLLTKKSNLITSESAIMSAKTIVILGIVTGLVFAVVLFFIILIIRSITVPIKNLENVISEAGSGNLTMSVKSEAKDEIGRISSGVDNLILDLRGLVNTVKERLNDLGITSQGLMSNMSETGASINQINANLGSSKKGLTEQSEVVREVINALNSLVKNIEALDPMIQDQSDMITSSSSAIESMINSINSVAINIKNAADASGLLVNEGSQGSERINEAVSAVSLIVEYAKNLHEATEVITGIADMTKLLAMNAAIEAAHAGVAGRGFAVVAGEIGKLSAQSSEQAARISRDLGNVAKAIEKVKKATDSTINNFTSILDKTCILGETISSINSSMTNQRDDGQQVVFAMDRLREITKFISDESKNMVKSNNIITQHANRLEIVNTAVVRNNEEMASGTMEIDKAVTGTLELCNKTGELVSSVITAADKFTV